MYLVRENHTKINSCAQEDESSKWCRRTICDKCIDCVGSDVIWGVTLFFAGVKKKKLPEREETTVGEL